MVTRKEQTEIRRKLAAACVRQMKRLMDQQAGKMQGINRSVLVHGAPALEILADRIEQGKVKEEDWDFLTWIKEDAEE